MIDCLSLFGWFVYWVLVGALVLLWVDVAVDTVALVREWRKILISDKGRRW